MRYTRMQLAPQDHLVQLDAIAYALRLKERNGGTWRVYRDSESRFYVRNKNDDVPDDSLVIGYTIGTKEAPEFKVLEKYQEAISHE